MPRSYIAVSVSLPPEMVPLIVQRCKALGVSRSQYLQQLIRKDLGEGGNFVIPSEPTGPALLAAEEPPGYGKKRKRG